MFEDFRKRLAISVLAIALSLPIIGHLVHAQQSVAQAPAASGVVLGSIAATGQSVTIPLTQDQGTVGLSVAGTFSGSLTVQGSVDYGAVGAANATWGTTTVIPLQSSNQVAITGTGIFQINAAGFSAIRVFGTALVSGQANIALRASPGTAGVMADNTFPSIMTSQYPQGATPVTALGQGSTAAATATLPAATNKTTFLCGFQINANATAQVTGAGAASNLIGNNFPFLHPILAAPNIGDFQRIFNPCIPATGPNTTIPVVSGTPGAGGAVDVYAWGYQL